MRTHAPCGACCALIELVSGCPHWRPAQPKRAKASGAENRKRREVARQRVEEFGKMMGVRQ